MARTETPASHAAIGLYRAGLTDTKRLVKTTIGRSHVLDDTLDKLHRRGGKKSGQNLLFIGPRGIGKTHLLTLIEDSVTNDAELNRRYTVIRFPEENLRLLTFADFLLGLTEILASVTNDTAWKDLHTKLHEEEDDETIIDCILPRLKSYHKTTGATLLILLENIDTLLTEQFKKARDIHCLRGLLMDNAHIVFIGTSPVFFPALNDVKHPLYDFFDIQIIDELSESETLNLIHANLEWDDRADLLERFDELTPKIQALHTMTGGNPRLIMMLYELIGQDHLAQARTQFQQLLDRISPFYQDRIKDLPPQERAVLETLALMRTELRTPTKIARKLRMSQQQTSTLLKRMTKAGYLIISPHPGDRRSRLYRIKEGFFDLWLAMSESRVQRKYLPYLVDFFSVWYSDAQERENKRRELEERLKQAVLEGDKTNCRDTLGYLSEVGEPKERFQTKLDMAVIRVADGDGAAARELLAELPRLQGDRGLFVWMRDRTHDWLESGEPEPDIRKRMESMIEYWREQRSGNLETAARLAQELSYDFSGSGLHKLNIALLDEQLQTTEVPSAKLILYWDIARSQKMDGQLTEARTSLEKALTLAQENVDRKSEGTTLNNLATTAHARGDYASALRYLEQSLEIQRAIGDKAGEGAILSNLGQIYHARGDYASALRYLEQSLEIQRAIGDKAGKGTTLNNLSQIYNARGDYASALRYLEQSLEIQRAIGDKAGEGATLNNLGQIFNARGDYDTALHYLEQSLEIRCAIGDKAGEGATLNNLATTAHARGDYDTALRYLEQSLEIQRAIGDKAGMIATLHNLGHIALQAKKEQEALDYWGQALSLAQETQNAQGIFHTAGTLGRFLVQSNHLEKGQELLKQAIAVGTKAGFPGVDDLEALLSDSSHAKP